MPDAFETVTQRVVPASNTRTPALNANASVFAAGDAAKPKRKSPTISTLDAANVPVKSGVPVPPLTTGKGRVSAAKTLLARMKKGDCVELSAVHARSVKAYAKKAGVTVVTRKLSTDLFGVWRTN